MVSPIARDAFDIACDITRKSTERLPQIVSAFTDFWIVSSFIRVALQLRSS
ncbi:MAG: hypothetical protein O3A00_09545 [Planctomycetota bacterium]|nr:hypothetical protein [Planctomycetota bacterium]